MQHVTRKIIGVAALGAALATAGAGVASADSGLKLPGGTKALAGNEHTAKIVGTGLPKTDALPKTKGNLMGGLPVGKVLGS